MFYYNGGVEKCDQRAIDKLRGYLNQNGVIVWKERPIFGDYDLFDNDCVCSYCHYYHCVIAVVQYYVKKE